MAYPLRNDDFQWSSDVNLRHDLFLCLRLRFGPWTAEGWTQNHKPSGPHGEAEYEETLRAFCVAHGKVSDKWTAADQQVRFALSEQEHQAPNHALFALLNRAAAIEVGFLTNRTCLRHVRRPDGSVALERG